MEYIPTAVRRWSRHFIQVQATCFVLFLATILSTNVAVNLKQSNRSPAMDFIDLDEGASPYHPPLNSLKNEVKNTLGKGKGYIKAVSTTTVKTIDVTFDDDDLFTSGSGSGSGDDNATLSEANGRMTPTESTTLQTNVTSITKEAVVDLFNIEEGGSEQVININGSEPHIVVDKRNEKTSDISSNNNNVVDISSNNNNVVVDTNFVDTDTDSSDDLNDIEEEDEDSIYDLPPATPVTSNRILNPVSWGQWSDWFVIGTTSKIRVRSCQVTGGREINEVACEGVRVQLKSCEDGHSDRCGKIQNFTTVSEATCVHGSNKEHSIQAPPPPPPPAPQAPPIVKPDPDICQYSLYDNYRQKYVFTRWNLTELITKSKVKRWCDKKSGQYMVMTTPDDHCRRYYKDLCKVSERCHANKPTKERGDFAEGCWRNLVYNEMLPTGLSSKQTAVYFICQRFAAQSKAGKLFGYKETHFGTLFDTSMKSPVIALNKITRLGDETWPVTDYFIEHGLVENESNMLWLFKKPRKGMLTLLDLDRCPNDQSCDVGLRQTLPHDYEDQSETGYSPTHLMWPELMPNEPGPRVATFTLTNMAPMLSNLFDEWHHTVLKVRRFAIEKCGVPVVIENSLKHLGEFSSHRINRSTLYIASGVLPSVDPVVTTGHGVRVPFMFWMAGCCVQHHNKPDVPISPSANITDSQLNINVTEVEKTSISGFAVYIRNAPDSHVITAPILQLEMLLQDMYKSVNIEGDVGLFPGNRGVCSDLKNDVSRWFQ